MDEVGSIDDRERVAYIVVGNQDSDTTIFQFKNDFLDFRDIDRIDACEGFIHKDEFGVRYEAAGNFQPPPLATAKRVGFLLGERKEAKVVELFFDDFFALPTIEREGFGDGLHVLPNGELFEYARFLG